MYFLKEYLYKVLYKNLFNIFNIMKGIIAVLYKVNPNIEIRRNEMCFEKIMYLSESGLNIKNCCNFILKK